VGDTTYCDYPPEAEALPKVGGLLDPNVEAILGLRPDVVILLRTNEDAQLQLKAMGIPTRVVEGATVEQVLQSIVDIGQTCGCAPRGIELSRRLRGRLHRVETAVGQRPKPTVLISVGRTLGQGGLKDVYVAGEDGYFSELIRLAGGRNACGERSISFPLVSQEGILQMAPDVIIELASDLERSGYAKADIVSEWRTLEHVPAVKSGRIHVFTEDYVTVPGPRFVDLLDHMALVLHPDLVLPPLESPQ